MGGIIMGALGGLGEGMSSLADTMIKNDLETQQKLAVNRQDSDLTLQRAKALEDFKNAPLRRIGERAQRLAQEEVPLEPSRVNALPAYDPNDKTGPASFHGDIAAVRSAIAQMPDGPDKDAALAQLQQQVSQEQARESERVAGQTRRRTTDEAFDAALAEAKVNDPVAYAVGKPLAAEKTMTIPEGATVIDRSGKVIFSSADAKQAREEAREDRRDARAREGEDRRDQRMLMMLSAQEARARMAQEGGRPPVGYRVKQDGSGDLEYIPGGPADPENKGKPLPSSVAIGLLTNQDNLRRAQRALALVNGQEVDGIKGDKEATGAKGYLPNNLLNIVDREGVNTRAAIADLGSMVIHDRSGAAVTASEFPRLAPFVPTEKDSAETVQKKLRLFVQNYQALLEDQTNFFRESGYKVPVEVLKSGQAKATAAAPSPVVNSIEEEMRKRGLLK